MSLDHAITPVPVPSEGEEAQQTAPPAADLAWTANRLRKAGHKIYEVYATSRIFHLLNDPQIEFVTQQLVRRPDGKRALMDVYFPQFNLFVEIDEPYHDGEEQERADRKRTEDLRKALATRQSSMIDAPAEPVRLKVAGQTMAQFNEQIDRVVARITSMKKTKVAEGTFEPFVFGRRASVDYWRERGTVSVDDRTELRTRADVGALFGVRPNQMKAVWRVSADTILWWPKFYDNALWSNVLSSDGTEIVETDKRPEGGGPSRVTRNDPRPGDRRLVFAHTEDEQFGGVYYNFAGVFTQAESGGGRTRYVRVADTVDLAAERAREGGPDFR